MQISKLSKNTTLLLTAFIYTSGVDSFFTNPKLQRLNGTHSEYILRGFLLNDLLSPIKTALGSPACVSKGFTRYCLAGFFSAVDLHGIPLLEGTLQR